MRYLALLILFASQSVIAGVGTVTETTGSTSVIQRKLATLSGVKGIEVEKNDAVQTLKGKVGITFINNTHVQINEHSKVVVNDFTYDAKKQSGKLVMNVGLGTVRYISDHVDDNSPQNVVVSTPSATISLSNTDFAITVDEVGGSTVILLPICDQDRVYRSDFNITRDCKTGKIWVTADEGRVLLSQPFQATNVDHPGSKPLPPVVLKLSEAAINNLLIVTQPPELQKKKEHFLNGTRGVLAHNFLDNEFLANLLNIIKEQLLNTASSNKTNKILPDWTKASGVVVNTDVQTVSLCRQTAGNTQCITVPDDQDSLIISTIDKIEIRNRVNKGAGTTITLIQR